MRAESQVFRPPWLWWLLAGLVLLSFGLVAWLGLVANTDSNGGDQGAYLLIGLDIHERVALTDGNRQPLFPLLIAPFAQRAWPYFTWAKLVALLCGLIAMVSVLLVGRRALTPAITLGAATLLAANSEFLAQVPQVLCEGLMVGLSWLSIIFVARALTAKSPKGWAWAAGLALGAAYITKGTGILLILASFTAVLLVEKGKRLSLAVPVAAGIVLLALPMWIVHARVYGNPFYNFNSTHAFWFETWDDRYLPVDQWPTLGTYLNTHSLATMVSRLGNGLLMILPVAAEALRISGVAWAGWLGLAGGVWLMARAVMQLLRPGSCSPSQVLSLLTGLCWWLFLPFFGWFAIVTDAPRFFLPLVPLTYAALLIELDAMWRRLASHRSVERRAALGRWSRLASVVVVLGLVATSLVPHLGEPLGVNPFRRDVEANRGGDRVVHWLDANAAGGEVLWGPSHTLPKWMLQRGITLTAVPSDVTSWPALQGFVKQSDIGVVVLDDKMYKRADEALGPRFDKSGKTILFRTAPGSDDWRFAFVVKGGDTHWYVLRSGVHAPDWQTAEPAITFAPSVRCVAYAAGWSWLDSQPVLELDLLWEALAPEERDLTAYVHVLDGQGQRVGQLDQFPLGGMYPTSFWKPGEQVADHYAVPMNAALMGQDVRVLIGWYDLESHEQIEPAVAGDRLVDHGALLIANAGMLHVPAGK